ncbi:MAG: lipoate--protein ligase family protein [Candidatus Bathyarchaeia archaeon]|jgi:lipoate-protein ligase A
MKYEETWRLLDAEYPNPYMNLALEEAIPSNVGKGASPNTIRFWRNPNAVVIGNFQSADTEVNLDLCKKHQVAVVRRFTGGGAVYHDSGNLNCAISVRRFHPLIRTDLGETFARLSQGVIEGLRLLGAPARFEFPNSIQVNGRKIAGEAGAVKSGFVFHHCSILVSSDLKTLLEILNSGENSAERPCVRSARKEVSTLSIELGRELTIAEVKDSLRRGFEKDFRIRLEEGEMTEEERALAEKLHNEKYSTETWNFKQ